MQGVLSPGGREIAGAVQPAGPHLLELQFRATVMQSGYAPGSQLMIGATLSEYGVPVDHRAKAWAEMTRPDGTRKLLTMNEEEPGRFAATTVETYAGLYTFRVRASGLTFRERPFTREQTRTAVIGQFGTGDTTGSSDCCKMLECLLAGGVIQPKFMESMHAIGIDWAAVMKCVRARCLDSGRG